MDMLARLRRAMSPVNDMVIAHPADAKDASISSSGPVAAPPKVPAFTFPRLVNPVDGTVVTTPAQFKFVDPTAVAAAAAGPMAFTFGGPPTAMPQPTDLPETTTTTTTTTAPAKYVPAKRVHFADDSCTATNTTAAAAPTKRARPFAIDQAAMQTGAAITKARTDAEARIADVNETAMAALTAAAESSATAMAATEEADQLQEEVARLRTQLAEAKNKAANGVAEVEAAWNATKQELAKVKKEKADLEKVKDEKVALEQKVKDAAVGLRGLKECQRAKAEVEARAEKADREVKALKRRCQTAEARIVQAKSSKSLEAEIASLRVKLAAAVKEREAGVAERAALDEQLQRAKAAEAEATAATEAKLDRARAKFVALTKDRDTAVAQRKTMAELLVRAEAKEAAAKAKVDEMGTKLAQMKRDVGKHQLMDALKAKLVRAEEKIKKLEEEKSARVYAASTASASASSCLVNPSKWLAKAKAECDREKARADALQKQLDTERWNHSAVIGKAAAKCMGAGRMVMTVDAATETDGARADVQQLTTMITNRIAKGKQSARARISVVRLTQLVALARIFKLKQQVASLSAAAPTPFVKTDVDIQTNDVDFATDVSESGDDQFTDMASFVLSLNDEDSGAPASFASLPSTASTVSTLTSWPRAAIPSGPWDPPTVTAVVEPPAAPKPTPTPAPKPAAAPKAPMPARHSPAFASVPDPWAVPHVPHPGYYQAPPRWPMAYAPADQAGSAVRGQYYPSYTAVPTAGGWVHASPHDAAAAAAAGWTMAPMWAVPSTDASTLVASKPAKRRVETKLPTSGMPYPPPQVRRARAVDCAVDLGMQAPPPPGFARRGVAAYTHGTQRWSMT
ncbi:hypothetical protein GGF31_003086 [Allomyces arbusculus]|nr:hypothetical protein GGF31_003086 [Allomyces arbusculus]